MSDDFPTFITVAFQDRLSQCEYIRRGLAEKRVDDLQQRIRKLETALHLIRNETEGRDVLLFEIAMDALEQQ